MKFASGTELRCHLDGDHGPGLGAVFIGESGKIELNRGQVLAEPAEILTAAHAPQPPAARGTAPHVENWLDCIKSRKRANADIEIGQRSSTLCYLVNIVRAVGKVGKRLHWDSERERFTNCDEANVFLDCERRAGWELPSVT